MRKICFSLSLLSVLSLYAWEPHAKSQKGSTQQFDQADDRLERTVGSAYSHPARVELKDSYNTFVTASYLYWFAGEDGLDYGTTAQFSSQVVGLVPNTPVSSPVYQDFEYNSGFKLGVGYELPTDEWVIRADYTRYHQKSTMSRSLDVNTNDVIQLTNWFYQVSPSRAQTPGVQNLNSKWRLSLDWLDLVLERPFYSGRRLTLTPFMGVRGSLITQTVVLKISNIINFTSPPPSAKSYNTSHAWAIGPRFGVEGRFLLGSGVRFEGAVGGTLLYNKFTHVKHHEDSLFPNNTNATPLAFSSSLGCVRTMTEANLGFGWGMYFGSQYHFDASASYDFNFLPEQNQIRVLNDIEIDGVNAAAKSLYLHGLTITTTFNF